MQTDKNIEHGILFVKLLLKEYPHGNNVDSFPSLDCLRIFKSYFSLSDTTYHNVLRNLRAFGVVSMINYNEITLDKLKFKDFCKLKPVENIQADKKFNIMVKGGKD